MSDEFTPPGSRDRRVTSLFSRLSASGTVNANASHYKIVCCDKCGRRLKTWKGGHKVLAEGSPFCEGTMREERFGCQYQPPLPPPDTEPPPRVHA